jgi:magnesium transporter
MAEEDRLQEILAVLTDAAEHREGAAIQTLLTNLHPAEIAQVLESLPSELRDSVWEQLDPEMHADVLAEAEDVVRASRMEKMDPRELAAVTQDVDLDDAVDILQDLPEERVEDVLEAMDAQNRARLEQVLRYDEETAGGLMNIDVLTIRPDVTLGVVSRYLRLKSDIPEKTNRLMVLDRDGRLVGMLRLALLIIEDEDDRVSDHMETDFAGILADTPDHEVAHIFEQRDLISAPVVDEEGRLLGRITVDDVMDVIRELGERSLMATAGLDEEDDAFEPALASARKRTPWLAANLATALLAAWVIGLFEATLQQVVALAILMPVVASMGGIAGSQTLTVVIRAIALGQVGASNSRWLVAKELGVGLFSGLLWAVVVAAVAGWWFASPMLGLVAAIAIVANLLVAGVSGASIPLLLRRLDIDPALAGGVILTTVTDVVGFMAFLGLGTLMLL